MVRWVRLAGVHGSGSEVSVVASSGLRPGELAIMDVANPWLLGSGSAES